MSLPWTHSSGHTIWMRKSWDDREPDRFTMSVQSNKPDSQKFVVVSGNATWLTVEQALEVQTFLWECTSFITLTTPVITGEEQ